MSRLPFCKLATALVALAACQPEPTEPVPASEPILGPTFPVSGTFAYTRVQWLLLPGSGRMAASVIWQRDRAVRQIPDAAARLLQQPALSPDGTRMIVSVVKTLNIEEYGEMQLGESDIYLLGAVATSDEMLKLTATGSARSPDWSPDGQRIVFVSGLLDQSHIYVLTVNDGTPVRITGQAGSYETPRWSPDGRRLVFTNLRAGQRDIFVMDADGSALSNVTSDAWAEAGPRWSTSGARIAFSRTTSGSHNSHIFTVDPDGQNLTQLTAALTGSSEQPVWSPDGLQIAFAHTIYQADNYSPDIGSGIYVIYDDGSRPLQLTVSRFAFDRHPTWSR